LREEAQKGEGKEDCFSEWILRVRATSSEKFCTKKKSSKEEPTPGREIFSDCGILQPRGMSFSGSIYGDI